MSNRTQALCESVTEAHTVRVGHSRGNGKMRRTCYAEAEEGPKGQRDNRAGSDPGLTERPERSMHLEDGHREEGTGTGGGACQSERQ